MNIENDIFKRSKINIDKLVKYGFKKENDHYIYSTNFIKDKFRADIFVNSKNQIHGTVWDLKNDEEYTNFRIENNIGEFVSNIREEYKKVLIDIKNKCFENEVFIFNQTNRVAKYIKEKYNVTPEFLWEDSPGCGIFRCPNNKWFGIIMNIDESKLNSNSGEIEIINLKANEETINELIKHNGYYRAYHMNKKKWLTILLNDTVGDKEIYNLIDNSYNLILKNGKKGKN